jgi:hypothetical protein
VEVVASEEVETDRMVVTEETGTSIIILVHQFIIRGIRSTMIKVIIHMDQGDH